MSSSPRTAGPWPRTVLVVPVTDKNLELLSRLEGTVLVLSLGDLDARVAQVREAAAERPAPAPEAGGLKVDVAAHAIVWRGRQLDLTEQEFTLLAWLLRSAGEAHTFAELGRRVWGVDEHFDRTLLHSAMRRLRRKLAEADVEVEIESVRGYGFRLIRSDQSTAQHSVSERSESGHDSVSDPLLSWH